MPQLSLFKVTIFVTLCALWGGSVYGDEFKDRISLKPGYSAGLSLDFCKTKLPHHKVVSRPGFNLFAFTTLPFDPKKPSVMAILGGPGGLWNLSSASVFAEAFPAFNVVFFHYRGGGCSDFPSKSKTWDAQITSNGVVDDMEAIRHAYGVPRWQGILGWSAGTNSARLYAHRFPKRTGILILEGLSDFSNADEITPEQATERLLSSMRNRFRDSARLKEYAKQIDVENFLSSLRGYLSKIDLSTNFALAMDLDHYKGFFEEYYKMLNQEIPKYLSLPTFQAFANLKYDGESEEADVSIEILLDQFDYYHLDPKTRESLLSYLSKIDRMYFSFKYPDYADDFDNSILLSWRVLLNMTENDLKLPSDSLCTSNPMVVLNGTKDLATPVETAEEYLKNKSCASGTNALLTVHGGGHSSIGSVQCLTSYVNQVLKTGRTDIPAPTGCEMPVTLRIQ